MHVNKKCLVVSAVNLIEGGTLTVLIESLDAAANALSDDWEIIALVNSLGIIDNPRVRCIAIPEAKRFWGTRLLTEWLHFRLLSNEFKPDLWLSMHDITPCVNARRQAVYCHNPSPFYKLPISEALLDPKFFLFNLLYGYLYRINIGRNQAVVVQQEWIREEFRRRYACRNVIVAHPENIELSMNSSGVRRNEKTVFLYPALPRVFKNFGVIFEAVASLPPNVASLIEIRFTLDGTENAYSRDLMRRFGKISAIRFIGRQGRDEMKSQYSECDVVLFPSKLETWGLPISEAKAWGKPLLVADLPYSHETVGTYERISFLPSTDTSAWARAIEGVAKGDWKFGSHISAPVVAPYARDWRELWELLTQGL